jgi:hypothetical protein
MPRYRLRTLLILLAVGPMVLWVLYRAPSWWESLRDQGRWIVRPRSEQNWGFIAGPPREPEDD